MILISHPQSLPSGKVGIAASVERRLGALLLRFELDAPADTVVLPAPADGGRADELWRATCFEAFIGGEDDDYAELNLAPSTQWAAYAFDGYRRGMRPLDIDPPQIAVVAGKDRFLLAASVQLPPEIMRAGAPLGLSAVIEETDGTISHWALRHPAGRPDFHHRDCFAASLP